MAARYVLPLESLPSDDGRSVLSYRRPARPESILAANALWFCQLRWIVVVMLAGYGLLNLMPPFAFMLGLRPPGSWPFVVAGLLALANTLFMRHIRGSYRRTAACRTNLWTQIVSDLVFLTAVVHFSADLQSILSFAYLFHIVLACIFFGRRESFVVLTLALLLYSIALSLNVYGLFSPAPLLAQPFAMASEPERLRWLEALLFCTFCLVIWMLTSRLSERVRERDKSLSHLNRSLVAAQEAKAKHMLRTTHELKAPFAAIQANVQLLIKGYCGPVTDEAMDILNRMDLRCRRLSNDIREMLQLANLRSTGAESLNWRNLDISTILRWCVQQVQPLATERKMQFDLHLQPAPAKAVEEQVRILFSNILGNAIHYSPPEGCVSIHCRSRSNGGAHVEIRDTGIGIEADKLSMIFDEYYRTDRAAQYNKTSSGLGLAIVCQVAQSHRIVVLVESEVDKGTCFTLDFPPPPAYPAHT